MHELRFMRDRIRLIGFLARAFSFLAVLQFFCPVLLVKGMALAALDPHLAWC
ncbi:MAG: hypothetical protein QG615_1933 [Nitrospirota bacterium]|nr:hypothetical protein [Nitrospirota bacterium]